ncbi:MAG: acyl esterase [Pseudomonadota bacterium]
MKLDVPQPCTDPFEGAQDACGPVPAVPRFSICTLVTSTQDYARMRGSFTAGGFTAPEAEYLYIDNRTVNRMDAYTGLGQMLARARGTYVLLCHQDISLIEDDAAALTARLAELDRQAPDWALAGNAGGIALGQNARRISDPYAEDQHQGALPAQVQTLDENFIVVRRAAMLAPSRDIAGFHLYGTDLCTQARLRGWSSWVIDFHLRHHSEGRLGPAYFDTLTALELKYAGALAPRIAPTTCLPAVLGRPGLRGWLLRLERARKRWRRRNRDWHRRPATDP